MSKMSEIAMELDDQLAELGFENIEQAEANGYHITYTKNKVCLALDMEKEQEKAHKAWLKERFKVLADLKYLIEESDDQDTKDALNRAIDFLQKGEC